MIKDNDPDYYAARLRAEREAAAAATCDEARACHLELAEYYRQMLSDTHPLRAVNGSTDSATDVPAES